MNRKKSFRKDVKQFNSVQHIEANLLNGIVQFNEGIESCFHLQNAEFIKNLFEAYINKDKILYNGEIRKNIEKGV